MNGSYLMNSVMLAVSIVCYVATGLYLRYIYEEYKMPTKALLFYMICSMFIQTAVPLWFDSKPTGMLDRLIPLSALVAAFVFITAMIIQSFYGESTNVWVIVSMPLAMHIFLVALIYTLADYCFMQVIENKVPLFIVGIGLVLYQPLMAIIEKWKFETKPMNWAMWAAYIGAVMVVGLASYGMYLQSLEEPLKK
jgi:hypothetical protein